MNVESLSRLKMISVAVMGNTSWVCDPRLVSYALEQAERHISHARANKVMHNFAWTPLYSGLQGIQVHHHQHALH